MAASPPGPDRRNGSARSADELIDGVLIGGGVPELHHLPVAKMENVHVVGRNAAAAPAGRGGHQHHAMLVIGEGRVKVQVERPLCDLHELAEEPVDGISCPVNTAGGMPSTG